MLQSHISHSFSQIEGPYSYHRRQCTRGELVQVNIPDPDLDPIELRRGVHCALGRLVTLVHKLDFKHLKQLYATGPVPENNLKYLQKDARSWGKSELKQMCEAIETNATVHSTVLKVEEIQWRDRDELEVKLQMEALIVAKMDEIMDIIEYKTFHLFFVVHFQITSRYQQQV